MNEHDRYSGQKEFWEFAGQAGYGKAQFSCLEVEKHIMGKQWDTILSTMKRMSLRPDSRILELGCGDGSFSAQVLGPRFKSVDAFDISSAGIERAKSLCGSANVHYEARDVVNMTYAAEERWDAAFLVGFLHHVKPFAASVIEKLSGVCSRAVVLEPNGDNWIRKGLEFLPHYKAAGEASFRRKELLEMFRKHGFSPRGIERINLIPPFLPERFLPIMKPAERIVENSSWLAGLCSTYVIGFEKNAP